MRKYAIIGASGLIGSHLTKKLVNSAQVYAFSRSAIEADHPNLTWVKSDLQDESFVNFIPKDVNSIIYLAQSEYFRDFPDKALEVFKVNVQCYLETLNYAVKHKIKHVIYASSGGVYGQHNRHFSEEDEITLPGDLGFYLGSKICAEIISSTFSHILDAQILRFFFVYGVGQKESMLFPRLIKNIKEGTPISLDGVDGIRVNPLYVSDAVSAIEALLKTKNSQTYNAGGDGEYNLRTICNMIGDILRKKPIFITKDLPEKKICGDTQKLQGIGWSSKFL